MKLIINNNNKIPFTNLSLISTILICFALPKCMAHTHTFKDSPNIETTRSTSHSHIAHPPDQAEKNPSSFPPSEAPHIPKTTSTSSDQETSGHSSSFSAAFSDILKGSLRGHSLIIPQHSNSETKHSNIAVEQICAHTDYPDVCLATIPPLLSHNFDVINVLEAAIKACSLQIKLTITKVAKHAARSPEIANAVAECREQYNNALGNLQMAMDAIPSRDLGTVTVMLSAVMADVSTCESAFEDLKSSSSVMSKTDGLVSITVSNCLSIANLIPY